MERQQALVFASKILKQLQGYKKNNDYRAVQNDLNLIAENLQRAWYHEERNLGLLRGDEVWYAPGMKPKKAQATEQPTDTPAKAVPVVEQVFEVPPPQEAPAAPVEPVAVEPKPGKVADVLRKKREWEAERQGAVDELLQTIKTAKAQLAELGYTEDEPAWVAPTAKRAYTKKATKKAKPTTAKKSAGAVKFCPICNAETPIFPHDGRRHRYQKKQKPFTEAELKEFAAKAK